MSKLTKNFGLTGAAILGVFDAIIILGCFNLSGMTLFNEIVNNSLPCGLLLSLLTICTLLDKAPKKIIGIITTIFCGIFIFLRLVATGFYIYELASIAKLFQTSVTMDNILSTTEYFAFVPLFVACIFLVVYLLKGKLKKATQILSGVSIITMIVIWIVCVFNIVSSGFAESVGFIQIFINLYNAGFIWKLFIIAGYTMIIASLTGSMEKKA